MAEAAVQFLLENLKSVMTEEIRLILKMDDELEKLRSTLTTIQAVLEDAELKQAEESSSSIRDWLRKLNLLVYEIEDILDECNTHASQVKHSATKRNPLKKHNPLDKFLSRRKIGSRVKQVTAKLDGVAAERDKFHLQEIPVPEDKRREATASWRETGSMLNKPVLGRDEDRDKIVKMLVDDHHVRESQHLSVLPIIGVGGLGKTTLAQLVFKDPLVVEHFEKRIWVCVSDNFDIKKLVIDMIGSATGSRASDLQLERLDDLQRRLWEQLSQKRFLIVLDDVWNDDQKRWLDLKDILSCGSTGASIIVTTRQENIAKIMGTLPAHCLKGLSNEDCWILFRQYAFGREEEVNPELELIGKEIVKKCAGVPLAAQALGGILRLKREETQWTNVRDNETLKLLGEDHLILPTLRLSYHHLPLELRQCFAYFAAFPKDRYIKKKELIRLWIAHGFISSKETVQMEDVGNEICNELILRSLLQPSHYDNEKIGMHDLVHDLAESVMENKVPGIQIQSDITRSASTIRQVNLQQRTILFPKSFKEDMDISSISKLTSLRVLDASDTELKDLPPFISNLKHLRYLNLSASEIRILPDSLCNIWNLKILNLDGCYMLEALPKNIRYLKNLQHLCLAGCSSLCEMPTKMRELSNLKTLSMFIVGQNKGNQLEELQYLDLCGSLEIQHLERVKEHLAAKKANIAMKKNLRQLSLRWERNSLAKFGEDDVDEKVLEALEPHSNLEKLSVNGFSGKYLSLWKRSSTMRKIVQIRIMYCDNCKRLPKLGELPHLKFLHLRKVGVEYIIEEEEEVEIGNQVKQIQFQALEKMELHHLPNLKGLSKENESTEAFQNVKTLLIEGCSSFILPRLLSSFKMLKDLTCGSLNLAQSPEMDGNISLNVNVEKTVTCFLMETLIKFTNLRHLRIRNAKEISVKGEDMKALNKLERFYIEFCKIKCIPEGMLRHLTSLRYLSISFCSELEELPDEIKYLLNLEEIFLSDLPKMAFLPSALQYLSSLRSLQLWSLPEVESLPDCLHQLTSLTVWKCTKVASLPAAVPNLLSLTILDCPELERQCKRGSGKEWHKIAHIPDLRISSFF